MLSLVLVLSLSKKGRRNQKSPFESSSSNLIDVSSLYSGAFPFTVSTISTAIF
jgi:hypothetical protein